MQQLAGSDNMSIDHNTFSGCTSLTAINIDNTLNTITKAPWGATSSTTINWLR